MGLSEQKKRIKKKVPILAHVLELLHALAIRLMSIDFPSKFAPISIHQNRKRSGIRSRTGFRGTRSVSGCSVVVLFCCCARCFAVVLLLLLFCCSSVDEDDNGGDDDLFICTLSLYLVYIWCLHPYTL